MSTASDVGLGYQISSPWPHFHGDSRFTGQSIYSGCQTATIEWSYFNGLLTSPTTSQQRDIYPIIGSNGNIYIGSATTYFSALNSMGSLLWHTNLFNPIYASASLSQNGTIYVVNDYLRALDPNTGAILWTASANVGYGSAPTIGPDGTIYVVSNSAVAPYVYAFTPQGSQKWQYKFVGSQEATPVVSPDGNSLYFGATDGSIISLNIVGTPTLNWQYKTGLYISSTPAIGPDGTIFLGSADSYLYALSPTGTLKWKFQAEDRIYATVAISAADNTLYFGAKNMFYALSYSGTLLWTHQGFSQVVVPQWYSSAAIDRDGVVYAGSDDSNLYAFYPSGSTKWVYAFTNYVWSAPTIGADGSVLMYVTDGNLYKLKDPIPPTSTPTLSFTPTLIKEANSGSSSSSSTSPVVLNEYYIIAIAIGSALIVLGLACLAYLYYTQDKDEQKIYMVDEEEVGKDGRPADFEFGRESEMDASGWRARMSESELGEEGRFTEIEMSNRGDLISKRDGGAARDGSASHPLSYVYY